MIGYALVNRPRPHLIPTWDFSLVLQALQRDPFVSLQLVKLSALSKTTLLIALACVKRVWVGVNLH